jgi:hypothetical protein
LAQLRNSAIQKHLEKNINLNQSVNKETTELAPPTTTANKERIILISLLVVSLASIGGLLVRLKRKKGK